MSARSEEMKFTGRALALMAEMNDAMDDAIRALEHDDHQKARNCMAQITLNADEILNLLSAHGDDDE